MEITSTAFLSGLATIFIAWMLMMVVDCVWLKPKKLEKWLRQQGFSGNSYRLLYGDMKEMSAMRKQATAKPINLSDSATHGRDIIPRILPFNHHVITTYGKKSFTWNGPTPSINISDPKMIREILFKKDIFHKPKNPLGKLLVSGMVSYEGEQWYKVRKIANPAFHQQRLKDMFPSIYLSCEDMISKWKNLVSNQNHNSHHELDVWPYIQTLTAEAISRIAFGSSYEDGRKIFELIREQMNHLIENFQFLFIPGWRFLPTATNRKMRNNYNETRALIKRIINEREEAIKLGEASNKNDDLLGMLIKSNYKEIQEHKNGKKETGMSTEEVIEECKLFYLAGQETTASLLTYAMVLLCMHPHWQSLAREEVLQVFGDEKPKFDDLNHLKVVTKILYETLRLYPPAPLLRRMSSRETKLGEINIRSGIMLSLPIIIVHQDHEYWGDDAEEFNPDRFSEGVSKASKNNEVSFFPFGWGPRICIGQNFSLMEAKLALAMILQNFSFELSPAYAHAPTGDITIQPQYGAHLILHNI